MKCVIPCANVKVMARAFHALAKIGEEMYVMPQERSLSFRSVSMANSAYCDFTFGEHFFTHYNYGNLSDNDALKCKVPMRAAMAVFKTPGVLDKLIESCQIRLHPNAIKLMIILKYKNSVTKRFLLPIIDCEALQASYDTDTASNQIIAHPSILGNALHNFQQNLIEITLDVSADKMLMRNYIDDTSSSTNATRTQLALAIEMVGTQLRIHFESAGKPVIFLLKSAAFEAHLVLSTLDPENQYPPDTTIRDKRQTSKKRTAAKSKKQTAQKKKANNIERSTKTAETFGNILALVHQRDKNPGNSIIDEPELISAIRSTSIDSRTTSNGVSTAKSQRISTISTVQSSGSAIPRRTSLFPNPLERRHRDSQDDNENDDTVPDSPPPPAKRAKTIFKRCFENTFDPKMLPGHETLLANVSDEENI
ncbi:cell cycle checkpoint control protein RAD9A isoform X2 [Fopius arisanus]|uniref:Cell cycle checkpoint control protein RAD9A isoform X2 n=1 Tax=Fopius arisanus TaxID=64838 RepID=A0A0C9RGD3_9HYME|nr:PREDICTED: cell cycle checkpoint control protein RAD9A isoform X2 [Fopius arisanus]